MAGSEASELSTRTPEPRLKLKAGDVIVIAFSDPIRIDDGKEYTSWDIKSVSDLKWVLNRTISRIGVTVARSTTRVQAIATYRLVMDMVMTPNGLQQVRRGVWTLDGPTEVDEY